MTKTIRIIGVPMDLGQQRRGVDMGPSALRYAGLQARLEQLGYTVHDEGNIAVPQAEQMEVPFEHEQETGWALHLPQVARVCHEIYEQARSCFETTDHAIFLGGDHSISIGTVSAVSVQGPVGVVWFDAHADINTPHTTPSGNVHGMPVAALLGDGPPELTGIGGPQGLVTEHQIAMIGIREVDTPERQRLKARSGIGVYTMRAVDERGIAVIARDILDRFADLPHIHISLDLDGMDPRHAPGVGTPSKGGLSYREAHLFMEIMADSGKVRSMDIVEINPILDTGNTTAEVAVELAASLFGQRIL